MDVDKLISKANEHLKFSGVSIKREGGRLALRAKFPPKPNGSQADRLSLGWHATPEMVQRAESLARKISGQIDLGEFNWCDYLKDSPNSPTASKADRKNLPAGEWARLFEEDYFDKRDRNNKSESTWQVEYYTVFKKLPNKILTPQLLKELVLSTKPDTRTRKRFCMCLNALAKFAGVTIDLKPYAGKYGINSVKQRLIPEDYDIAKYFYTIEHPAWQWVYGMIAAYGLRNYEPFRIDVAEFLKNPNICILTDAKTGPRMISPYYPEWVEAFNLKNIKLPNLNPERSNRDLGGEAAKYFKSIKLPFTLLPVRHAWAIRTLVFELDISWAAKMMGHSVEIHSKVYHHWISRKQQQAAHDRVIKSANRPLPPAVTQDD